MGELTDATKVRTILGITSKDISDTDLDVLISFEEAELKQIVTNSGASIDNSDTLLQKAATYKVAEKVLLRLFVSEGNQIRIGNMVLSRERFEDPRNSIRREYKSALAQYLRKKGVFEPWKLGYKVEAE